MTQKTKALEKNTKLPISIVDYFFPINEKKDTIDDSPLVKVSRVLQSQGISKTHLCEAIAILIGIISSRLGDPVPMIITEDEGAGAVELLDTCLNLVPENSWIDITTGQKNRAGSDLSEGKTIISYEAETSKDLFFQVLTEIELRNKLTQKRGLSSSSFVAITKNPHNPLLQNRYVSRIHISADQESKSERLKSLAKKSDLTLLKQHKIESACLRTLFDRIKASPVDIEFADQIINKHALNIQNVVPFYDAMLRILRNITRINNSPPLRPEELEAAFIGLDLEELATPGAIKEKEPIKATKIDYFYFLMIFEEMFKIKNDFITPRQFRIYHAIISHNIEYFRKKKQYDKLKDQQLLDKIHESGFSKAWVTRSEIVEILKTDGGELISDTTLHNELQELLKLNLITERNVPRMKNKSAYAATQVIENASFFKVHPSDIEDSIYKKSSVEVKDIITSKTVTI